MRILVVDDEPAVRFSLREILEHAGHAVREAEDGDSALAALEAAAAELVITDLRMPGIDGLGLLERVRARWPDTLVVLVTAQGDERTAVRALKLGAWNYLPKPFDNDEIRVTVERALEVLSLRAENRRLREELASEYRGIVGEAPAMREVIRVIRRAGPTDATVLITGESGTGKELAARALHAESPRAARPFVALNCSALPADLVESELFGHVKGAFTGADRDRDGLFVTADRGTLFLDEVGDLAGAAQAKLLRAIEAGEVTPVGASRPVPVDVRLVAATNRPLAGMVERGEFREDLLWRLQVVTLALPPLRERRGDVPALATRILAELAQRHGREVAGLTEAARRALVAWDWPGNVRELRNALERAVVLAEGPEVDVADLPERVRGERGPLRGDEAAIEGLPYGEAKDRVVSAFERSYLAAALERHGGNVSAAARSLGLHRQSLQKMLKRLDLPPDADVGR
ncbi:MAG TPA: sigma-54 dependent transcriptional regulator [Gemmatimonadota bacterium]|nr:sigma-54 dependent transcriptional regulator [Gemmatimonadota bacterium]